MVNVKTLTGYVVVHRPVAITSGSELWSPSSIQDDCGDDDDDNKTHATTYHTVQECGLLSQAGSVLHLSHGVYKGFSNVHLKQTSY